MKRQQVIWLVIGVLFAALLGARILQGQVGRVYVEEDRVAFRRVETPPPPWMPTDAKTVVTWTPEAAPADAGDATGRWVRDDGALIGWTRWKEITPTKAMRAEAEAAKEGRTLTTIRLSWPRTIGLWLAAFFTLAIFSFLYRDNPFYKFTEAVIVGVSAAYWMVVGFWDTIVPKLMGAIAPGFIRAFVQPSLVDPTPLSIAGMALAAILGVMLLMQLVPKVRWVSVWPLAFVIGTTAGLKLVGYMESDFVAQIRAAVTNPLVTVVTTDAQGQPLASAWAIGWASFWPSLQAVLLAIGTLCTLVYFFFSLEHKGVTGRFARVGIWFLMITFGAAFGFTVMGRVTLLAKRFEFLFDDWLWLIDPKDQHTVLQTVSAAFGFG